MTLEHIRLDLTAKYSSDMITAILNLQPRDEGFDTYVNSRGMLSMCPDPKVDFNGHDADFATDGVSTIDLAQVVPFPAPFHPMFLCIDSEHKDFQDATGKKPITEIEFAVINTLDIVGIPPGN